MGGFLIDPLVATLRFLWLSLKEKGACLKMRVYDARRPGKSLPSSTLAWGWQLWNPES